VRGNRALHPERLLGIFKCTKQKKLPLRSLVVYTEFKYQELRVAFSNSHPALSRHNT
jgi:hypothetical protein